ncbi:mixed lineage kinase domain-like protein [Trematomus bernacchii]|uniref:mixed lineage kinase domain-like protein n=1 Tax=Trematomus bernacchii TaxID=40690 RepID=UPI00146D1FE4|nr:mixed lineage kinase domain-like protein [Trematomus bernacchii]
MDSIEIIVSIASQIYCLVENVKANKKRCRRVCNRVKALEHLVKSIQQRKKGQTSADVERCLKELSFTLQSAEEVMKKYSGESLVKRVLKCGNHEDEFYSLNDRLDDAFQILSGSLQVEQGNVLLKVFEKSTREKEDELDRKQDDRELKIMLLQYAEEQQEMANKLQEDINKIVKMLEKPYNVGNQIIKQQELKYELDGLTKKPFMTTPTSEVYRGEYRSFPVAIKRYTDPATTNISEVKKRFNKDVETMKVFQSPNILRMFGICVEDETGPKPQFLIIMEYCEKGSLREVLDSGCILSWNQKARMCRDAALGLYRLHQSEEKCKVHGCINSSKFLVADGYTVKLGGFEFTQTETSLRKPTRGGVNRSFTYSSPELLEYINNYSKECEVYSLGIVLWEVATGRKPFDGLTVKEVHQKVFVDKYQERLDDCPKELELLINACRAYNPFQRPSAGVLVDKLKTWVTQLEKV